MKRRHKKTGLNSKPKPVEKDSNPCHAWVTVGS